MGSKRNNPYISKDNRLLRPHNFPQSVPGKGFVIYKDAMDRKVLVINVMARLFMDPLNDPYRDNLKYIR
jgi:calcineurin-like phosphoesterase